MQQRALSLGLATTALGVLVLRATAATELRPTEDQP
jgi:hypothetical protein